MHAEPDPPGRHAMLYVRRGWANGSRLGRMCTHVHCKSDPRVPSCNVMCEQGKTMGALGNVVHPHVCALDGVVCAVQTCKGTMYVVCACKRQANKGTSGGVVCTARETHKGAMRTCEVGQQGTLGGVACTARETHKGAMSTCKVGQQGCIRWCYACCEGDPGCHPCVTSHSALKSAWQCRQSPVITRVGTWSGCHSRMQSKWKQSSIVIIDEDRVGLVMGNMLACPQSVYCG